MNKLLIILIILLKFHKIRSDLPIHCLRNDVIGKWKFSLTKGGKDYEKHCGYPDRDTNKCHFEGYLAKHELQDTKDVEIELKDPNVVSWIKEDVQHGKCECVDKCEKEVCDGKWTMIYDEGMQIEINGYTYLAFFQYKPKNNVDVGSSDEISDYVTNCEGTMTGWYHNKDLTDFGCWKGSRIDGTGETKDSGIKSKTVKILSPNAFVESTKDTHHLLNFRSLHRHKRLHKSKLPVMRHNHDRKFSGSELFDMTFQPDLSFIEIINSDPNSSWKAGVHEPFVGKPMGEMMKLLGASKFNKDGFQDMRFKEKRHHNKHHKTDDVTDGTDLPEEFDWRAVKEGDKTVNYLKEVRNQGNCGSCFVIAALSAAESRIAVASKGKDKPTLSPNDVLGCSFYNQGCDGGYPILVAKTGKERGFAEESSDNSYTGSETKCDHSVEPKYKIDNYEYVGGYYGALGEMNAEEREETMKRDLVTKGPMVVAFEAPSDLFSYQEGVFTGPEPAAEPHWQHTNHAVTIVGYGTDPSGKYWIVRNSWGKEWGQDGYFKIRRGTNECAIESMAVTFDIKKSS